MFGHQMEPPEPKPGTIVFHPQRPEEYNVPHQYGHAISQFGFRPKHRDYICGACGSKTTGRVLCDLTRESDGAVVSWCICSCEKREPTLLVEKDNKVMTQHPCSKDFHVGENWPQELADLYEEASRSFAATAYTACAMVCRKLLMATACENGAVDGKKFVEYVEHITQKVLTFPKAQDAIDRIRAIGNEANHRIAFVAEGDARKAMLIVTYMLNTIYSLPSS